MAGLTRGASRQSLAAATERMEPLLAGEESATVGEELLGVARLLDSSAALRRALTDPSRDGADKAALVERVLSGQASGPTVDVVSGLARSRWSSGRDLADACEHLGFLATVATAERHGSLDAVEDELFRFGRIVAGDADLQVVLGDRHVAATRKTQLVDRLLDGKVGPQTHLLARTAVAHPRGRRTAAVIEALGTLIADRRSRTVARVETAVPLTQEQRGRLLAALGRVYGRTMHLTVDVDPSVVGGLRVQVGDEVVDATVVSRLADARRRLAG